jgi:hypothetical protein
MVSGSDASARRLRRSTLWHTAPLGTCAARFDRGWLLICEGKAGKRPRASGYKQTRAIGGIFSSAPRRTSRAYSSVITQLLAAVVCAHAVRRAFRKSSQLQSSGDATGTEIARRTYFLRQHTGQ